MKRKIILLVTFGAIVFGLFLLYKKHFLGYESITDSTTITSVTNTVWDLTTPNETKDEAGQLTSYKIELPKHYFQTFNNCGPATLAMVLNFYGVDVTQQTLGTKLRPYQNPQGDNDDKSTSLEEMAAEAENYGFRAYFRPNGTIEKLTALLANDIPVVAKTWLDLGDDIGHYRVVTGFNNDEGYLVQDDSYQGRNRRYSYEEFLKLWEAFNYQYLVVVPTDKAAIVEEILGEEVNKARSWELSVERGEKESAAQPNNPYLIFNQVAAHYNLGNYGKAVELFEQVESKLPRGMLWYQLEPIASYKEVGDYDRALELIENILSNGNRAYSELYILRGDIYLEQGKTDLAKAEYEKAVLYNENLVAAKEALEKVQ